MAADTICPLPEGTIILRTLAMPADTNVNGDIFGGWIMAQMDIAGGILAKQIARTRTVTVAVESMKFIRPVQVGDIVSCYGSVDRLSLCPLLTISVGQGGPARYRRGLIQLQGDPAKFTYVAVDGQRQGRIR
ncbi:MAG: hotdog domain-containing protein [Syntrophotaleaceae bacterium]